MKELIENIKNFYNTKRNISIIIIVSWIIITIGSGIVIGRCSREKIIPLTPEEENAKILLELKGEDEKIIKGEILSTKDNLSFEQLEYSSNYVKNRKKKIESKEKK